MNDLFGIASISAGVAIGCAFVAHMSPDAPVTRWACFSLAAVAAVTCLWLTVKVMVLG